MNPKFLALLTAEDLKDVTAIDVGCGTGQLALTLAPLCRRVIGIDRDAGVILAARERAATLRLDNAEFIMADAEAEEYTRWAPQLVAAHLCMSPAIIARASRALGPGELLAFVCFHVDQWKETGKVSRFAYDEDRMRQDLGAAGFTVEHLEVERRVREFASKSAALTAVGDLRPKWEADGRWANYVAYLRAGGRELTRSHVLAKARRR